MMSLCYAKIITLCYDVTTLCLHNNIVMSLHYANLMMLMCQWGLIMYLYCVMMSLCYANVITLCYIIALC